MCRSGPPRRPFPTEPHPHQSTLPLQGSHYPTLLLPRTGSYSQALSTGAIEGERHNPSTAPSSTASRIPPPPSLPTSVSTAHSRPRKRHTPYFTPHPPTWKRPATSLPNSTTPDSYRSTQHPRPPLLDPCHLTCGGALTGGTNASSSRPEPSHSPSPSPPPPPARANGQSRPNHHWSDLPRQHHHSPRLTLSRRQRHLRQHH
jgi:hypothetical protein